MKFEASGRLGWFCLGRAGG